VFPIKYPAHQLLSSSDPVARPVQFQSNITRYIPKPVGAVKRNIIDQQVLKMIVKEYYHFSIVEDSEFLKLSNILNPILYHQEKL